MSIKTLVIVESPAKAKTIQKYLNECLKLKKTYGSFIVKSSLGHIRDLRKKELGINEKTLEPIYDVLEDKKKTIAELVKYKKQCKHVLLAADEDREGEAIAWHLIHVLKLPMTTKRIVFHEITKQALETAVLNPRAINMDMVDAQQTRRVLDRLVGFKLSPLLWKNFTSSILGLSAGRVQSAALLLLYNKENDIETHRPEMYWSLNGNFKGVEKKDLKLEEFKYVDSNEHIIKVDSEKKVTKILKSIKDTYLIEKMKGKNQNQNPPPPFITSTLQQDSYSKCGFSVKRTMSLAQNLYEKGFITYMRTDSTLLSQNITFEIKGYILDNKNYGEKYYKTRQFKTKNKNAQEAHECIRPTKICTESVSNVNGLTSDHQKLYNLIWKRTVASQMAAAQFYERRIILSGKKNKYKFLGSHKDLLFDGYLKLLESYKKNANADKIKKLFDDLGKADQKKITFKITEAEADGHVTHPPAHFNESSLVKKLESEGIGRPSTYAAIINKLVDKNYVIKRTTVGEEVKVQSFIWKADKVKKKDKQITIKRENNVFVVTDIGKKIHEYLIDHFPNIINVDFTREMEQHLDEIAEHKDTRKKVLNKFSKEFYPVLEKEMKLIKKEKRPKEKLTHEFFSNTIKYKNIDYIIRDAKYGPVIQYDNGGEKPIYLNLKSYLKWKRKDLKDIELIDVKYILKFPIELGTYKKKKAKIVFGPFGFYMKHGDDNCKIPWKLWGKLDKLKIADIKEFCK